VAKRIDQIDVNVPVIVQTVGGDLVLRGRGHGEMIVDGDNPQIENIGGGQPYMVHCGGDCRVFVPPEMKKVVVYHVGGDARIADLEGNVEIESIGGDLTIGHVGRATTIRTVGGDLRLKWAEGDVTIQNVGGDATLREIGGNLHIQNVGADLFLRAIEGSCIVDNVGDDLVLNIAFHAGHEYRFNAGSDILCRIQPDTGAQFRLPPDVEFELDVEADVTEKNEGTFITVGDGAADVWLSAGSELRIIGEEEDYVFNLGAQIEEELEARLSSLEEKLNQQFEGLNERIQAHSERFAEHAARIASQAARHAERQVERARRSLDRRKMKSRKRDFGEPRFAWGFPPEPPAPPRPPVEPVREEERLMVLRMVQDGKITIEEAERLLAALENRE